MAYIVGKDDKRKKDSFDLLSSPGSFQNIKSQLQQQQINQPVESIYGQPNGRREEDEGKPRYSHGGIHEEEDDDVPPSLTGPDAGPGGGFKPASVNQQSGGFTNIQDLIEANQPQTQELREDIVSGIEGEAGKLGAIAQEKEESFFDPETGSYRGDTPDFISEQIGQAGQDQTDEDKERFRRLRLGTAKVPELERERTEAEKLSGRARRFGTSAGRLEELQRSLGQQSPAYSKGQKNLDQLLLSGGDPDARRDAVKRVRQATEPVERQLKDVTGKIRGARASTMTQVQRELTQAREQQNKEITDLQERARNSRKGQLTTADLENIGIDTSEFQSLYGVDPSQFITGNRVTQNDLSRLDALASLAGQSTNKQGYREQSVYDPKGLKDAIDLARSGFRDEITPIMNKIHTYQKRHHAGKTHHMKMTWKGPEWYSKDIWTTRTVIHAPARQAEIRKGQFDALKQKYKMGTTITAEGQDAPQIYNATAGDFRYYNNSLSNNYLPDVAARQSKLKALLSRFEN